MSNVYDSIAQTAFGVVADTMGHDATWQPSSGGEVQSARVLFREPSRKEMLGDVHFLPNQYMMEYYDSDFSDLKTFADNGYSEVVTIDGKDYTVLSVRKKYDGHTLIAHLEKNRDIIDRS